MRPLDTGVSYPDWDAAVRAQRVRVNLDRSLTVGTRVVWGSDQDELSRLDASYRIARAITDNDRRS